MLLPISTVGCDCSLRITVILIIIGVFFCLDSVINNLVIKSTVILISWSKYYTRSWKILYGICVQFPVAIIKPTLTALLIKPKRLLNRLQAIQAHQNSYVCSGTHKSITDVDVLSCYALEVS